MRYYVATMHDVNIYFYKSKMHKQTPKTEFLLNLKRITKQKFHISRMFQISKGKSSSFCSLSLVSIFKLFLSLCFAPACKSHCYLPE